MIHQLQVRLLQVSFRSIYIINIYDTTKLSCNPPNLTAALRSSNFVNHSWLPSIYQHIPFILNAKSKLSSSKLNMPASYNIIINLLVSDLYYFDPLHPNISIHIFHTALFTFVMVFGKEDLFDNQSYCSWWSFSSFS